MGVEPHDLDQGRSLKPVLSGAKQSNRDDCFAELGPNKMLFDGRYKLLFVVIGPPFLMIGPMNWWLRKRPYAYSILSKTRTRHGIWPVIHLTVPPCGR